MTINILIPVTNDLLAKGDPLLRQHLDTVAAQNLKHKGYDPAKCTRVGKEFDKGLVAFRVSYEVGAEGEN